MKKNTFLAFVMFLVFNNSNAQVLYEETFNSYNIGNLGTDITGTIPGQGSWLTKDVNPPAGKSTVKNENFRIAYEKGRGNYLLIESSELKETEEPQQLVRETFKDISNIWQYRDVQNNILKLEWEFSYFLDKNTYSDGIFIEFTNIPIKNQKIQHHGIRIGGSNSDEVIEAYQGHGTPLIPALIANQKTWQKIIIYVDYNNYNVYFEFPSKNYAVKSTRQMSLLDNPMNLRMLRFYLISTDNYKKKFLYVDNIVISAVNSLPKLNILNINSDKFNLYPNPAATIVNITNTLNMFINEVEIYDLAGKLVNTQNFNNEAEIQLNVQALTNGTYLLHLKTNEGMAVKKLIKK